MASEVGTSDFDSKTVENLLDDVELEVDSVDLVTGPPSSGGPSSIEDYDRQLLMAELERLNQQSKLRSTFFWVASGLASFVILASTAGVGLYVILSGAGTDPAVLITWMTAVVVELLGILKIIAVYLYPNGGKKE
ncbi:hypothetical protein [Pseudarthrobacter sp. NIBRBAC000502770]|uniref:hypothetical protein n=1 Tax=Pseudarthrobacter sp. NIBRBAC000502770 TaxID=2590785 RepID=UPI0011407DF7|nr:hypothetical protein [Pseudarthrobacter sp. NIBRBAC000502770]QDG90683.1 hypothetical protein NIBR502770_20895 [Pseudarthrobacter sp. NIBRBAC000502770]